MCLPHEIRTWHGFQTGFRFHYALELVLGKKCQMTWEAHQAYLWRHSQDPGWEKSRERLCLLWNSAIQPCFVGDCLVCLHEVICLCVEVTVLLITAAGIRGWGEAGEPGSGCRHSNGCDVRHFLWGHARTQFQATWWLGDVDLWLPLLSMSLYFPTRTVDQESVGPGSDPGSYHPDKC